MDKIKFLQLNKKFILNKCNVVWPPSASNEEITQLGEQRNLDIGIKGRTGPIKELEEKFLEFLGNELKYAITFNSGTSGLFSAYFAIGLNKGDEIIGPAMTYHAALSPAFVLGAKVILCDVDIETKCIIPENIEKLITPKTKAITVVHQWGHSCDMDKIIAIAQKYNLYIIEDCSHAHGSKYKGKYCGTFGDVAIFSLQTNKTIFCGEGGILVTNNIDIYERATLFGHYRDRSKEEIITPERQELWSTGYGLKLRMSPFNAIVGIHSLNNFPEIKKSKHICLKYLNEKLKEISYIDSLKIDHKNHDMGAWYGFKPIYKLGILDISIEDLVNIFKDFNLAIKKPSGGGLNNYKLYTSSNNLLFPEIESFSNNISNLPNTVYLDAYSFSFPTFYDWDKDKDNIDQYIETLKFIGDNIEIIKKLWKI